jgi:hypothetical protein
MGTGGKDVAKQEARSPVRAMQASRRGHQDAAEASAASVLRNAAADRALLGGAQLLTGERTAVEALQRVAGNRAVCELLSVGQAKLEVGPAGDRYEREADTLARRVVAALQGVNQGSRAPADGVVDGEEMVGRVTLTGGGTIGRAPSSVQDPEVGLAGGALPPGTEAAINSARRGGTALDTGARSAMEGAFGADFGEVKVHSGPASTELNNRVQAKAFTVGSDIFFRDRLPDPRTSQGQELLAHELAHTIQQGAAKARPTS